MKACHKLSSQICSIETRRSFSISRPSKIESQFFYSFYCSECTLRGMFIFLVFLVSKDDTRVTTRQSEEAFFLHKVRLPLCKMCSQREGSYMCSHINVCVVKRASNDRTSWKKASKIVFYFI